MKKNLTLSFAALFMATACSTARPVGSVQANLAPFEVGASEFPFGDSITISEIHSSTSDFTEGSVLTVRGTYDLKSREGATLYLGTTTSGQSGVTLMEPHEHRVSIVKGAGTFELTHTVPGPGHPHVTFYDQGTGKPFGGSYFGRGSTLLVGRPLGYDR